MVMITFMKAAAFAAAIAPIEAFMPASTFGVKQVRGGWKRSESNLLYNLKFAVCIEYKHPPP
jgi:hypothetical protein